MTNLIRGKYFAFTSASVTAGEDLIDRAQTLSGESVIVAKSITLTSSGSLSFDINSLGKNSTLSKFSDIYNRMEISHEDNWISSVVIGDTSACPVSVEIIF